MKADRLLALLLLLQARGRASAGQLAAELEVTPRTVRRDVDALSAAGVPVYAERGRRGGYALLDDWRTDATGLTGDEVRALFTFAGGGAAADLGLGEALAGALRKLAASLPATSPREASSPAARTPRVLVEGAPWSADGPPAALPTLHAAVESGRRARIRYRSAGSTEPSDRTVDPLGLVSKAGRWYLVAGVDGAERLFRVDRVASVEVLAEPAARPPDASVRATWQRLRDAVPGGADEPGQVEVVARVRLPMLATLERLAARAIVSIEPDAESDGEAPPPDDGPRGSAIVRLRYPGVDAARGSLLGFGAAIVVLEPPEVRAAMVAAARAVLDQYAAG